MHPITQELPRLVGGAFPIKPCNELIMQSKQTEAHKQSRYLPTNSQKCADADVLGVTIKLGHKKARKMMRKNNNNNSRIYFGLVSNIDLSVQENHEKLVVLVQRVAKLLSQGEL